MVTCLHISRRLMEKMILTIIIRKELLLPLLFPNKSFMAMFSLVNHCINHKEEQEQLVAQPQVNMEGVN